jgi:hypothetical protein
MEVSKEALEAAQEKAREIDLKFNPYNRKSDRGWRGPAHRDRLLPILQAAAPAILEQERERIWKRVSFDSRLAQWVKESLKSILFDG